MPLLLRREEGLEDLRERVLVHPGAGVGDDELDVRCSSTVLGSRSSAGRRRASRHAALTARLTITCSSWPGSARTRRARRELRSRASRPRRAAARAAAARRATTSFRSSGRGFEHLPAAEREQLLRQLGRALGRRGRSGRGRARSSSVAVRALEQQRRVAGDPGQEVVEVVRDAAGEAAERLELLRAEELRLEPLALRDVAEEGDVEPGKEVGAGGRLGDSDGIRRSAVTPTRRGSGRRRRTRSSPARSWRLCSEVGTPRSSGRSGRAWRRPGIRSRRD